LHLKPILIALLLFSGLHLKAQLISCIDSGRVNPTYQCNDQFYNPVCGCNNVTYRNQCNAYNNHGVSLWRSGVCSGIDMDFYPNPVGPSTTLTINLSFDEFVYANADVKIVDMYGKTWEQRIINNFNRMTIQFDVLTLKTGMYLIVVSTSKNTFLVRKLAKY
jgi:hypothetical protein